MILAQCLGMMREAIVSIEMDLILSNRLEEPGDIFHLGIREINCALQDPAMNLVELVRPRKLIYEKAKRVKQCPMLVDSRNRILRPDPPPKDSAETGTIVGTAISPGVATGKVRMVHDPTDEFEPGEVLVAVVTDPTWTPLFVGAAAVVLQIGGVLQHGALCAREYGKPGVSGIPVMESLKDGMVVCVDGNVGTVKVLGEK